MSEKIITEFSAATMAKNEEETLPRLDASLKGIEDKWLLDTGSTDNTVKVAKELGWQVVEVGDKFKYEATQEHYHKFKEFFGLEPTFKVGEKYFHYADARNYLLQFPKNDWVFQADADEVVSWDIQKVKETLADEDHLVYRFCFSHKPDGSCGLEFTHTKFFRKSKIRWGPLGWVHEVEQAIPGQNPKPPKYVDFIYHHHYQNHKTSRSNYLPALELSVTIDTENDRNLYYLAREWFWNKL